MQHQQKKGRDLMAKAKRLASGAWRVQVYAGKDANGKNKYISITRDTEKEANFAALEYQLGREKRRRTTTENMTLREAIGRYIESRDAILSPSTVREYRQMQRNALQGLMDVPLNKLTQEMIQREINSEARRKAPKTVHNIHGILSGVLKEYIPDFRLTTKLPQKTKTQIYIPDMEQVNQIISAARGTDIEIPILLAICLGLRRSEILALKWDDIDFDKRTVTISKALVLGENSQPFEKVPKTYAGNRAVAMPDILFNALKEKSTDTDGDARIIAMDGAALYKRFKKILKTNNIPDMRFHDLRHVNASIMLALNIPNKYAAERMGHSTENMLKNVYQHTIRSEAQKIDNRINSFFAEHIKE